MVQFGCTSWIVIVSFQAIITRLWKLSSIVWWNAKVKFPLFWTLPKLWILSLDFQFPHRSFWCVTLDSIYIGRGITFLSERCSLCNFQHNPCFSASVGAQICKGWKKNIKFVPAAIKSTKNRAYSNICSGSFRTYPKKAWANVSLTRELLTYLQ